MITTLSLPTYFKAVSNQWDQIERCNPINLGSFLMPKGKEKRHRQPDKFSNHLLAVKHQNL